MSKTKVEFGKTKTNISKTHNEIEKMNLQNEKMNITYGKRNNHLQKMQLYIGKIDNRIAKMNVPFPFAVYFVASKYSSKKRLSFSSESPYFSRNSLRRVCNCSCISAYSGSPYTFFNSCGSFSRS